MIHRESQRARRPQPLLLLAAFCLSLSGCADTPQPNVILIVVDTLRADHLDGYGYERPTATALDRLTARSTRFADCTSSAPWTVPSVASLFTGLATARHRVNQRGARLPDTAVTLTERLRDRGYHTVGISFNAVVTRETGFAQGFDRFDDHLGIVRSYPDIDDMLERVARWLDEGVREPFFLYLQPMNTHGPYRVPADARTALFEEPPSRVFRYRRGPMRAIVVGGNLSRRQQVDAPYLQSLRDQYDTSIRYTTDRLGDLIASLDERGLYDGSLVIVTSDHGEELFDHGGFSHGYNLHRETLHVPLYIKLPGQRDPRTVTAPVTLLDVSATLLELTGIESRDSDGRSLVPFLRDADASLPERPRFYQTMWKGRCVARGLEQDGYKLLEIESNYEGLRDVLRLYDVRRDPEETRDLSRLEPERAARMHAALLAGFAGFEHNALEAPQDVLDELDHERLEALGYLEPQERADPSPRHGTVPGKAD